MCKAAYGVYPVLHYLMGLAALQIYYEVDSARVVFCSRPVETAGFGDGAGIQATGLLGCFSHRLVLLVFSLYAHMRKKGSVSRKRLHEPIRVRKADYR